MSLTDFTIIIPAYNEAAAISDVVKNLKAQFPDCRLLVINDCSTDNTGELAQAAGAEVINHLVNGGYGASLKTGIRAAKTEYVLMCDADGQHRAEDLLKVMNKADGYDMVIGVRDKDSHAPLQRRPGKFILKAFANYLAGEKLPDFNSGMRAFKRDVIAQYLHLCSDRFSFSTTSTFAMLKTNKRIGYVSITVEKRLGQSQVKQIKHGSHTLMLMLRLTILFDPLKVFLTISAWSFMLFLISLGIDVAMNFRAGRVIGVGQVSVMLFLSTVFIFLFGLVCDQISALRREIHEK